ncbi:MAG: hypothetical protein IJT83_11365 [Victivallales bacterium]|nr:hypothetical protein [Victivallales bacterium]
MSDKLHTILSEGRFRLAVRWVLAGLAMACIGLLALFGLLSAAGAAWGLREGTALAVGGLGILVALGTLVFFLARRFRRKGSLASMALRVEEAHPELMDSFICAVELEEAAKSRELRPLERELLEQVHSRVEAEPDFIPAVFRSGGRWTLGYGVLVILSLALITFLPAFGKFLWGGRALVFDDKGIAVEMQGNEAARHSDYLVKATVSRWEKQAEVIVESDEAGQGRYVMNHTPDGSFSFSFYDVSQAFRFKVVTPSLSSGWQKVAVYDPPVCEELRMEVTPLPYMQRKTRTFNEFCDLELVEGETVEVFVKTAPGIHAALLWDKERKELLASKDWLHVRFTPKKSGPCELVLEDASRHSSRQTMEITVLPDMPPVLALTEPTKDVTLKPGDSLRIMAEVADDFGLEECRLLYSVNGGEKLSVSLRKAAVDGVTTTPRRRILPEKEWEVIYMWDIPALNLEIGDLLSCMLVAEDNCEPKHHQSKSDLFFVVIRPDQDSIEMDSNQQGEQKKADISDLLAESKRLLRMTWDIMGMEASPLRERMEKELGVGLNELELEVRKRVTALSKEVGGSLGEPLTSLFAQVSEQLTTASRMVERRLFEESVSPQERALAALVAIETELVKNAMKSKGGEGEEQDSKENKQKEEQKEQGSSQEGQAAKPDLRALKEMLEELRRIVEQQENVNGALARENTLLDSLAARQRKIHEATGVLDGRIEPMKEFAQVSGALKRARTEMAGGVEALEAGNRQGGGIHGARSRMQLVAALRMLEEALRRASANEVKRLSEMAGQLAESQRREAQNSEQLSKGGKPDNQSVSEARERQNGVNEATERLKQEIREAVGQLEEDYPKATEAMTEALKQAETRGLQRSQTRAKNALLYKRFDRAAREQNDAGNYLQELAGKLHEAADSMPTMGEQELREMLEQLQNSLSQIQNAMKDSDTQRAMRRIDEAREQASRTMDEAARATKNNRLQELSNNLALTGEGKSPTEAGSITMRNIAEAAAIIGNMLEGITTEKQRQLLRRSSAPPEKYRRQVEDYFRKLGNE